MDKVSKKSPNTKYIFYDPIYRKFKNRKNYIWYSEVLPTLDFLIWWVRILRSNSLRSTCILFCKSYNSAENIKIHSYTHEGVIDFKAKKKKLY